MKRSQLNAISRYYQEQRHQEAYRTMEKYGKTMKDYCNSKYVNVCAYAKSLGRYTATIVSNGTNERTYEVETGNALAVAKELGRAEGGEIVKVYRRGELVDMAEWSIEKKKYVRIFKGVK